MQIHFTGDIDQIENGARILAEELDLTMTKDQGIPIDVTQTEENIIRVSYDHHQGAIQYSQPVHFFRGLGLWLEAYHRQKNFDINEEPQFTMNGGMFDCSRNAVMKLDTVKKMMNKMALMGLNLFMLYTEDTYAIAEEPLFGYMRGRYSQQELKEIDDYAHQLGIEVIPCIQTLAHLATFLQWQANMELRDTEDVLLLRSEKTYELIERMIKAASGPFRSNRIHIGMDEAHGLGRGQFLDQYGYEQRTSLMTEHLNKVLKITEKYQLKPMIWSDMYFRSETKLGNYYDEDVVIPEDVIESMPKNVQHVYWDYYHNDQDFYETYIDKHQQFGTDILFAGAVWTFTSIATHYEKTFLSSNAALHACKKGGVKEVFTTMWMDNGAENNYFSSLLGLQLYAEHGYAKELDMEKLQRRFQFCTGVPMESFMHLGLPELPPKAVWEKQRPDNPAKFLLYQDILIGLFDKHLEGLELNKYYAEVEQMLAADAKAYPQWSLIFEVPARLCGVLKIKSEIGLNMKQAYDQHDRAGLRELTEKDLPQLSLRIEELRRSHRAQWYAYNKPFGWEVLDTRYGGLRARVDTAIHRIEDFLKGNIDRIEEFEEEKIYFDHQTESDIGRCTLYHRIYTTNVV